MGWLLPTRATGALRGGTDPMNRPKGYALA